MKFVFFLIECKVWKHPRNDAEDVYPDGIGDVELCKLVDKQIFQADDSTIQVIHTPGHTTDHCILLLKETQEIFSGDCILGEGTAVFEDLYDYMKSLELIIDAKPTTIFPGHGNVISVSRSIFLCLIGFQYIFLFFSFQNPIQKIQFYIDHRKQRETQILDIFEMNRDAWYTELDLVKLIYIETPEHLWKAAARNVLQHLKKLAKENRIMSMKQETETNEKINLTWKYLK